MKSYITYIVRGYDSFDVSRDLYLNFTNIEVIATTEKQALDLAKKIIKKNEYKIIGAYEKLLL